MPHPGAHHLRPLCAIGKQRHRLFDRLHEGLRGIVLKDEAGCTARSQRRRRGVHDGIGQPPRAMDDRQGPIAHAVHLVQSARLKARGHQERIRTRFDLIGQIASKAQRHSHPIRESAREVGELLVIRRVPHSEDHHLDRQRHEARGGLDEQIEALLLHQALDHADQQRRLLWPACPGLCGAGREALLTLQGALACRLALQPIHGVARGKMRIGLRVPLVHVDPIQNAHEGASPRHQDPVQPAPSRRGLNLLRVGGADR